MEDENKVNNEIETEEIIDINDIPEIESGGVDLSEFDTVESEIEGMEIKTVDSVYNEKGDLDPDNKRKVKVLRVYSKPITTLETKEGKEVQVSASELFNLKQGEDGKWGISKHERSKIQKFMKKMKVAKPSELKGRAVKVKAFENKAGNTFLGFYM